MPRLNFFLAAAMAATTPLVPRSVSDVPTQARSTALDPMALGRLAFRSFGEAQGLEHPTINAFSFDGLGRAWIGTNVGALYYDGQRWIPLTLPSWIRSSVIRTLAVEADGNCWLGTQDAGLVGWQGGRWVQHTLGSGLPSRRVNHLLKIQNASGQSELWVATSAGLAHLSQGTWTTEGERDGLPDPWVWRLMESRAPTGARTLWAATRRGLARREGSRWVTVPLPPGEPSEQANDLLMVDRTDGGQDLWVSLWGGGLARLRNGSWTRFGPREGVPSRFPTSLTTTPRPGADPLVWAGFMDTGLANFDGFSWRTINESRGLPSAGVYALANRGDARRPVLWVGMRGAGVARLAPGRGWVKFLSADGLPAEAVNTLAEVRLPSGSEYWAGTTRGLARLTSTGWKSEGPSEMINTLLAGPGPNGDHVLWAGTLSGLYRRDSGGWVQINPKDGSPPVSVYRILRTESTDGLSQLWVIGATVIYELNQGHWRSHGPENGLPVEASSVVSIPGPGGDRILLGSRGQGISELVGGRWESLKEGGPLPNATVNSLARARRPDGGVRLWAGTVGGGLGWLDMGVPGARWEFLTTATTPALPSDMVLRIEAHSSGDLYGFTAKGVFRLESSPGGLRITTYTAGDGLPSTACSPGGSMIDSNGRIWAGTAAGLAILDPTREQVEPDPPQPTFTEISVNGKPRGDLASQKLSHRDNQIRFSFLLPVFHREEDVTFRTQLVGAESSPTPWGEDNHREYPALAAGHYEFRLWGRDATGQVSGPVSIAFTISPPPWRSIWAFIGYTGLLSLGAGTFFRARTQRLRALAEELERAVECRTHELAESHARLQEAQENISELMASSSHALEDLSAWTKSMAMEIARILGLREIAIYERQTGATTQLQSTLAPIQGSLALPADLVPLLEDLPTDPGTMVAFRGNMLVGIQGLTGEVRGALVLRGVTEAELPSPARQLLAGFARQLGSALEMQEVRQQLAEAGSRRMADREELHARGVATLQLCAACGRCYDHTVPTCPVDAAVLQPQGLLPYRIRDRYRFESLLGSGGMGSVYAARDEELDRRVAIKLLNPDLFNHPGARLRFDREARALARINHPGVIHLFDRGELEDGTSFLVMELLAGQDLAEQIRLQGPGSPVQVAQLIRQVGSALGAAHAAGVIHRDIKPQNLILSPTPDGFAAKVLDFGVAKPSGVDAELTRAGMVIGTPSYMAPEQVQGQDAGPRTDLYALATVAYEALTGHRLRPSGDAGAVMMKILHEATPLPSAHIPGIPPAIDEAFSEALAKDPMDRPASVGAWADRLALLLEALPGAVDGWTDFESAGNPTSSAGLPTRIEARTAPAAKVPAS